METPKKPLNNLNPKNSALDQDETTTSSAGKNYADDDDDFDMPLDDMEMEEYDEFEDDDY